MGNVKLTVFVLLALGGVLGFSIGIGALSRTGGSDIVVDAKVNPNTASFYVLAELPSIGPARAKEIIKYRQGAVSNGDGRAFVKIDDLEKVHGIGAITAQKLKDFLTFE